MVVGANLYNFGCNFVKSRNISRKTGKSRDFWHAPGRAGAAPELGTSDLQWFNVDDPLTLDALRGRLVILDFWTFCCINCMHIIPALRAAEERYPDDLAVIGVHSPKFEAEKDPANLAQAIARYDIVHPVVHDPEFTIWKYPSGAVFGSFTTGPPSLVR